MLALLAACSSTSLSPRVEVSTFAPGSERAHVEAKSGEPRSTRPLGHGQTRADYEVRLIHAPVRPRQSLALHADRASMPGGLALTIHTQGQRDLDRTELAMEAANLAFDYLIRRVSNRPEPARPEPEREPRPPRLCRVEVVYDHRGRVLRRRIVPLEDAPTPVESWQEMTGPVGHRNG